MAVTLHAAPPFALTEPKSWPRRKASSPSRRGIQAARARLRTCLVSDQTFHLGAGMLESKSEKGISTSRGPETMACDTLARLTLLSPLPGARPSLSRLVLGSVWNAMSPGSVADPDVFEKEPKRPPSAREPWARSPSPPALRLISVRTARCYCGKDHTVWCACVVFVSVLPARLHDRLELEIHTR